MSSLTVPLVDSVKKRRRKSVEIGVWVGYGLHLYWCGRGERGYSGFGVEMCDYDRGEGGGEIDLTMRF